MTAIVSRPKLTLITSAVAAVALAGEFIDVVESMLGFPPGWPWFESRMNISAVSLKCIMCTVDIEVKLCYNGPTVRNAVSFFKKN